MGKKKDGPYKKSQWTSNFGLSRAIAIEQNGTCILDAAVE